MMLGFIIAVIKEGLDSADNIFNIPSVDSLPGDDVPAPYFIVGDNVFGINKDLRILLQNVICNIMREYLIIDYQEHVEL